MTRFYKEVTCYIDGDAYEEPMSFSCCDECGDDTCTLYNFYGEELCEDCIKNIFNSYKENKLCECKYCQDICECRKIDNNYICFNCFLSDFDEI